MTTANLKRLSWLNEDRQWVNSAMGTFHDRTVEEVCWADARRTYDTPALMHLFRKLSTYPYLCSHSVKVGLDPTGKFLQVQDFNPLHHWSRIFEYPWVAATGMVDKTQRVLDAGGGHGPLQYWLADHAGCVVNVDGDAESLAHVHRVQQEYGVAPNLKLHIGDLGQTTYPDGHFDRVFCVSVLEHIPYWEEAASELFRVTARNGLLLITTDVCVGGRSEEFRNPPDKVDRFLKSWGYNGPPIMEIKGRSVGHFEGCEISALCVRVRKN